MANVKFSPDLFLEVAELNRFKQSLDDNGFRKNILDNTTSFGLIKNSNDLAFSNGRVERDLDTALGQRTIKIRELAGIDSNGNFIHLPETNGIPLPADGNWYWVKVAYAISNLEKGNFSISGNGDLSDTSGDAELTKILRGMPNFPSRISFPNSVNNTQEYDVLEVIDDANATIQHPATNAYGISQFIPEDNLQLRIVGTFTQGIAVPSGSKYPFQYDGATVTLELETILNTPPAYTAGQEFYIARVQATGSTVIIQDKRNEYWETKGSSINLDITRTANPLIGIESVQYNNATTPADRNIVKLAWGMRTANWIIDSTNNIVTFSSGNGGKFKTVNDFTDGDFNGWRLYAPNGKYHRIVNSVKSGGAINCTLDNLEINNFSTDGGTTFITGTILAVPDCDQVEILFTPEPTDNVPAIAESFTFPVNELVGRCDVLVYKDPSCLYNVQYRYKNIKEYTGYAPIPSDLAVGYYTEADFDDNGNLLGSGLVYQTYTSNATAGFINLVMSPKAISRFRFKVDKGDLIGVNEINDFTGLSVVDLIVGTDKNYQHITGALTLSNNLYFSLHRAGAVDGNEFRIHFDCTSINLNGYSIFVVQDFGGGGSTTIKELTQADIYHMLNQENGIVVDCKYNGTDWFGYQNYDLGQPFQTTIWTRPNLFSYFDATTKEGKIRGYFGWKVSDIIKDGRMPVGAGSRTETYSNGNIVTYPFNVGDTGGAAAVQLTPQQNAKHHHAMWGENAFSGNVGSGDFASPNTDLGGTSSYNIQQSTDQTTEPSKGKTGLAIEGGDQQHENMPPYVVVAYLERQY